MRPALAARRRSPRERLLALVSALALASAGAAAPPAADPALSPEELARLDRGELVARLVALPGERHRAGLAAQVLPHPPDRVLRAVADADHWAEWVPFLTRSERDRRAPGDGDDAVRPRWELAFDLPLPLRDRHYGIRMEVSADGAGGGTVSWASVPGSGNVASARGSFTLAPRGPAGTLVVFRTATDPGDATPRFLLDRALLESLPWVLDGLRQQVNRCRYTEPWPEGCREERPWTGAAAELNLSSRPERSGVEGPGGWVPGTPRGSPPPRFLDSASLRSERQEQGATPNANVGPEGTWPRAPAR